MTAGLFLIDTPHAAPQEFRTWEDARAHHRTVFLRRVDAGGGSAEQSHLGAGGQTTEGEAGRLEQAARTAWLRAKRQPVEIHLSDDTRETRHYFAEQPLRIHAGFTHEGAAAGWRQVLSFSASPTPDTDTLARTERARSDAISQLESYWAKLADAIDIQRVIYQGAHYTWNVFGEGTGFGGQALRVGWLTADRKSIECNLSTQGRIPVQMRGKLPDNIRTIEDLDYRINPSLAVDNSLDDNPPYQSLGVSPAGSGFHAAHRAACGVLPLQVSVPGTSTPCWRYALRLPSLRATPRNFHARKFRLWI